MHTSTAQAVLSAQLTRNESRSLFSGYSRSSRLEKWFLWMLENFLCIMKEILLGRSIDLCMSFIFQQHGMYITVAFWTWPAALDSYLKSINTPDNFFFIYSVLKKLTAWGLLRKYCDSSYNTTSLHSLAHLWKLVKKKVIFEEMCFFWDGWWAVRKFKFASHAKRILATEEGEKRSKIRANAAVRRIRQ